MYKKLFFSLVLAVALLAAIPYGLGLYVRNQYFKTVDHLNAHLEWIGKGDTQLQIKNVKYQNKYLQSQAQTEITVIDKKTNSSYRIILNHVILQGPVIIESLQKIFFKGAIVHTTVSSEEPWFQTFAQNAIFKDIVNQIQSQITLNWTGEWVGTFGMPAQNIPVSTTNKNEFLEWGGLSFQMTLARDQHALQFETQIPKIGIQGPVKHKNFQFQNFKSQGNLTQSANSQRWFGHTLTQLEKLLFQNSPTDAFEIYALNVSTQLEEQGTLANEQVHITVDRVLMFGYDIKPFVFNFQLNQLDLNAWHQITQKKLDQNWGALLASRPSFVLDKFQIKLPEGSAHPEWHGEFNATGSISIGGPSIANVTQLDLILSTVDAEGKFKISKSLLVQILREKVSLDMKKEALAQLSKIADSPAPGSQPPAPAQDSAALTQLTPEAQAAERERRVQAILTDLVKQQFLVEQSETGDYALEMSYRQNQLRINDQPMKPLPSSLL